jgi:hypothetical protein
VYLNGIQIVEKNTNNTTGGSGFGAVKGGFVGATATMSSTPAAIEESEDEDLPF